MASRPVIIASLLGASVGVPYIASQAQHGTGVTGSRPVAATAASYQPSTTFPATAATYPVGQKAMPAMGAPAYGASTPIDGAQFTSVAQVLRFDVTKEWVCTNWSRKSTGPTDVGLFAIRVPLVMGTQMTSLAGALTYFFNAQGQVEHISFHGRTGDATQLVQFLTQYKFEPVGSPAGVKVYQVHSGDAVYSELRLQPESILRSNAPQQSVVVELEFARPGSQRVLPPREPPLQVPQVAGPPAEATQPPNDGAGEGMSAAVKSAAGNYFEQVRYATPTEETLLRGRRWP